MGGNIMFCKGGGWTAKLGAGVLGHVLQKLPKGAPDKNLLIGYDSKDDAAVYRISEDMKPMRKVEHSIPGMMMKAMLHTEYW